VEQLSIPWVPEQWGIRDNCSGLPELKKFCTKQGEAQLGKPTAKLGLKAGKKAGGNQQSPRARTRAG